MNRGAEFAYTQARLHARHGVLPDAPQRRRLASSRTLAHFLQAARSTPIRPWLLNIAVETDSHRIERLLRELFRRYVHEVADWQPLRWRAATRWVSALADLPALQHLLAGGESYAWMHEDPRLRPFAGDAQEIRVRAMRESEFASLLEAHEQETPLTAAWLQRWHALWPAGEPEIMAPLDRLTRLIAEHRAALAESEGSGPLLQEALERRLRALFRRHTNQPATAFIHLALLALQLEWLRGALVRRSLFAAPQGERAA